MGTSSSFRAPPRPRWNAFVAALLSDASVDRIRSELFNAGVDWQTAIGAPAVASYARSLAALHEDMAARLASAERPDATVGSIVAEARHASLETGFTQASAIAERAFARLLLSTLGGVSEVGGSAGADAAERWAAGRGASPGDLVSRYLGEVLGQYARHVTDREAGRLLTADRGAAASGQISQELASRAAAVGIAVAGSTASFTDAGWADLVERAFASGRSIPPAATA